MLITFLLLASIVALVAASIGAYLFRREVNRLSQQASSDVAYVYVELLNIARQACAAKAAAQTSVSEEDETVAFLVAAAAEYESKYVELSKKYCEVAVQRDYLYNRLAGEHEKGN